MKAILLERPEHLAITSIDEPGRPNPGDALVRVHRVGICGTDISGYLGKMPFFRYPLIPGHELGVEVVEVGDGVTNVQPGDRCSVEPYLNCQRCFACRRGNSNCCESLQVLGVHTDGGMRSCFLVPARKLHPSRKLTFEQLALVETLGIGCHAVFRCGPQPKENVLVIGVGPIGLSAIEFLKLAHARIIVLDLSQSRLEFCKTAMGIQDTILVQGDGSELEQLKKLTENVLPTIVIDATGSRQSMAKALHYVGHTGKVVFLGITTSEVGIEQPLMHRRELTLMGSRNALPRDFGRIIKRMEDGKIDTRPWITHRTNFDRLISDFPSFTKPETGVIKAMVEMD